MEVPPPSSIYLKQEREWQVRNIDTEAELAFAHALAANRTTIRSVVANTTIDKKKRSASPCFKPLSKAFGLTLAQALINNVALDYLYLSQEDCENYKCRHNVLTRRLCVIDRDVGNAISAALYFNTTLTTLNLDNNRLGNSVCVIIATSLHVNTTLKRLSLAGNDLTSTGIEVLGEALKVNTHLQLLSLDDNHFGTTGVLVLSNALHINRTLRSLSLDKTGASGGGLILARMLNVNRSLRRLSLNNNNFGNTSAIRLAASLETNTTLTELYLTFNDIGLAGNQAFITMLLLNTTLLQCELLGNPSLDHATRTTIDKATEANRHRRDIQRWSLKKHEGFHPFCHERFFAILLAAQRSSTLPHLPLELWTMHILPYWHYKDVVIHDDTNYWEEACVSLL